MSEKLVLITGGTGFIGSHVARATLEAGFRVRLAIRKPEQDQSLRKLFLNFSSRVETVFVADIADKGAFTEALRNVDFVFHLASPMPGSGTDVRVDYVNPAVKGTEAILFAALVHSQIKKVVIVSSVLALVPVTALMEKNVSVKDNTGEVIPVDLEMGFPDGFHGSAAKYSASKILAHQTTRDFLKESKPGFDLITFHPVFVLGDSLTQQKAEDISGINSLLWASIFSGQPAIADPWVHVRDVADAHVRALETQIPTGTELILCGPKARWDDTARFLKTEYPALGSKLEPPFEGGWDVDTSTADRILGLKWRTPEAILRDVVGQQLGFDEKSE